MISSSSRKYWIVAVVLLLAGNIFFAYWSLSLLQEINTYKQNTSVNEKVLVFARLFVDKVLEGQSEISFDDRLALENTVRAINDEEIFGAWQAFTKAGSEDEAQSKFNQLFTLLLAKISI